MVALTKTDSDIVTEFDETDIPAGYLRDLFRHWLAAARDGTLPSREDFDPVSMPRDVLPWITIFDVQTDPLRFQVRLVGTGIVEATGSETTGRYVDELPGTGAILERAAWAVRNARPYFVPSVPLTWTHRVYRRYSTLCLPLAANGRDVDMLLYGVDFESAG